MEINVMDHTGLVHTVLNRNSYLYDDESKMGYNDLFQEGMIALIEAAKTYDESMGSFSNYAFPRIKWHCLRSYKASGQTIRKPDHLHQKRNDYIKAVDLYQAAYHIPPTDRTISSLTGFSIDEVKTIRRSFKQVKSLNIPVGEDGDTPLQDLIEDERDNFEEVEHLMYCTKLREDLQKLMDEYLPAPDQDIMKEYYGWDKDSMSLQSMAELHHLTVNQVRSKINNSLMKLRRQMNTLLRKHPDLIAYQVYHDNEYSQDAPYKAMIIGLFQFYAAVGDLITINERLAVITELRAGSFNYKVSGCEYAAFHSSIRDIQIMDEKITKLYIA